MIDISQEIPRVQSYEEFKKKIRPLYVIETYATDQDSYERFSREMTELMIGSFHDSRMITHVITFKFYKDDKSTFKLEFRVFLYNMYLWATMAELNGIKAFDENSIVQPSDIKNIEHFVSKISLKPLIDNAVSMRKVEWYACDIVHKLSGISVYFGLIIALHFSDHDIFRMYKLYGNLLHAKDFSGMNLSEIEDENVRLENELIERISSDPESPFYYIQKGGNPFKTKQLRELLMTVSLRPTIDGDVIPKPINNGLIMGALRDPSDRFSDAVASRIPALVNNKDMGTVGYFIKALNILTRTLEISNHKLDCESEHYVTYIVKTNEHLKRLAGKYMVTPDGDFRMIQETDTFLIGGSVQVKSVITCACSENKACPRCTGKIINLNWDITAGFCVFLTEEYSKDIEQGRLSTKHLIHPIPEVIVFNKEFHTFFELRRDEIYVKSEFIKDKNWVIEIEPDDILKIDEFDKDTTYNTFISSGVFHVINNKTEEDYEITTESKKKFFIRTETSAAMRDGKIKISDLDDETPVFEINIENNDAMRPFVRIQKIIELENKDLEDTSIDNVAQTMLDLFVEAGLRLSVTSFEFVLNRICRKPDDVRMRPNFRKKKLPKYRFYSLGKCLEENASPLIGMIYEQLQRQMLRREFEDRNATSFIDPTFKEKVSMKPLLDLQNMEDED